MTYFAVDGNYGDSHGLVILDTSMWTLADWERIDEAGDTNRFFAAIEIAEEKVGA